MKATPRQRGKNPPLQLRISDPLLAILYTGKTTARVSQKTWSAINMRFGEKFFVLSRPEKKFIFPPPRCYFVVFPHVCFSGLYPAK